MHGARRVPPAHENEQAYEEIEEADKPAVILDGSGLFGGGGDNGSLKLAAVAREFVAHLVPEAGMPQATRDLHLRGNWNVVDGNQQVARTNTGAGRRRVGSQLPSLSAVCGIQPGYTVIRGVKCLALDEVQPGKDHRRQRGKRQDDGSETDPQILLHGPRGIHPPANSRCNPMSTFQETAAPGTVTPS